MRKTDINTVKLLLLFSLLSFGLAANASGSFRLNSGKMISTGQSKAEVVALAGAPLYQEVETIAIDQGNTGTPIKREILTYKLNGSIGGEYLVVVTLENNSAVAITSKQISRL